MRHSHRVAVALGLIGLAAALGSTLVLRTTPADPSAHRPDERPEVAAPPGPNAEPERNADPERNAEPGRRAGLRADGAPTRAGPPREVDDGPGGSGRVAALTQETPRTPQHPARAPAPLLERTAVAAQTTSAPVRGEDPHAPRPLVLWREGSGRFARLAHTRSGPDGRFDFGHVAVPARGLDLVVTGEGDTPASAPPGSRLHLEPSEIPPPTVRAERTDGGTWTLELAPVRIDGALLVEDASGNVRAEIDLGLLAPPLRRRLRVALPADVGAWVEITHVLPDGRESARLPVPLGDGLAPTSD